ncbi:PREDICTED: LOW QUALITY PROTEIN: testis-expressed sequence 101 protein [Rhinopithecus bieti]|uniref:LOW QUALITY PROTEIN: testis-expressed sequence 101 protein n=1 Tax=Rhinopithecus bieti TaxID=61621 RepID=UPI00083C68C1|nr:PREDICTED: LOW QUALITY PROTEIN: testis-expressed sequence 101 protein [Rhinopithecus bieti]
MACPAGKIQTSSSQTSPEEAMGTPRIQHLLILLVLGTSLLTSGLELYCQKGLSMTVEADPANMFNWTTEEVETCDKGALCQETILMIKAGTETAILATKGCIPEGEEAITIVQHSPHPGLIVISYSNYCEDSFCNDKDSLSQFWEFSETTASTMSTTLHCPTCVALGTCFNAPSLPCPNGTTRCYQGKLEITGGGIESSVEVKGCTATIGCRLMSGVLAVGPMFVREVCPRQLLTQPRKTDNGATCLPIPVWGLQLLLPLLLPSIIHFS